MSQHQPLRLQRLVQVFQHRPGFRSDRSVFPANRSDAVHPAEIHHDPGFHRQRATHETGAAAVGHQRDALLVGQLYQPLDLVHGLRPHHPAWRGGAVFGALTQAVGPHCVRRVQAQIGLALRDALGAQQTQQARLK